MTGKRNLTSEQIAELRGNKYVSAVHSNRVYYTSEFKEHFLKEYAAGKKPTQIFREAGFDTKAMGPKRIERVAARWRKG